MMEAAEGTHSDMFRYVDEVRLPFALFRHERAFPGSDQNDYLPRNSVPDLGPSGRN
jgi:hypothetical protein